MLINGKHLDFPGINKISFYKLFETLEELKNNPDSGWADKAGATLEEMAAYPLLREGFEDLSLLKEYQPQIDKLMPWLFPNALTTNEIKGVVAPFVFDPFYCSSRFATILENAGEEYQFQMQEFDADEFYILGCMVILGFHYHYPVKMGRSYHYEIPNKKTGECRNFRMAFNADMMEVVPTENTVEISESDFHELMDNYENIELWKEKFPPNSWEMRGIGMVNLMDVTLDRAVSRLTTNLMDKGGDTANLIQTDLRVLFNLPDLKLSFTALLDGVFSQTHKTAAQSMILNGAINGSCSEVLCSSGYQTLLVEEETMVVSDVNAYQSRSGSQLGENLKKQNIGSFLIIPLKHEGEYMGIMELASPTRYQLNKASLNLLNEVLPIISMAVARFTSEANNRIEAIIQQECTTIHSSVKWRFEEEARRYMVEEQRGNHPQFRNIAFKAVYPLYGQLDIKGSSTRRNDAVKVDLLKQMREVKSLLRSGYKQQTLPVLEELIFRVNTYLTEIEGGLMAGSEHKILAFLRKDIYPVFQYLEVSDAKLSKKIKAYNKMLDSKVDMVYEARRDFDESVATVNRMLASFLDDKQEQAQAMFPHYFERYKTDGVEYNMYIGKSIVKDQPYHQLYLYNLRIWQLLVMVEMERKFYELQKDLKTPLEIASLILAYSQPLAIQFRMDEKRFDVDGAYNARYEIVKKRVDKAHIKGTKDRITVPYKIAIIYTGDQDALEYRKYIGYLQAIGYLKDTVEDLELEDLQGITGLKALRVEVNYLDEPNQVVTYDDIIEAIGSSEGNAS